MRWIAKTRELRIRGANTTRSKQGPGAEHQKGARTQEYPAFMHTQGDQEGQVTGHAGHNRAQTDTDKNNGKRTTQKRACWGEQD